MPNLVILVSNMIPPEQTADGLLHVAFASWTSAGLQADGDIPLAFGATIPQTHSALTDAAKAAQTARNGVTFEPADQVMIFGGQAN